MALRAISFYQRHVSPRKGFCCAYRAHTGCRSCSALAYRAIRRLGVWRGLGLLRERLGRCHAVHARHQSLPRVPASQAGFCDASCDIPCDLPGDCACDCGDWGRSRKSEKEKKPGLFKKAHPMPAPARPRQHA
jgi:putative component of membrane protein insertase Oxa1/YidC/SpoIIIJ protein YidD